MHDESRTRIAETYEMSVYSQDSVTETGLALTSLLENGKKVARRSNATDNTIFVGFSWGEYLGATSPSLPLNTTAVVPAAVGSNAYSIVPLPKMSSGVSDMAVFVGTNYGQTAKMTNVANAAAATDDTKFALSPDGNSVYVKSDLAGQSLFIAQRWNPDAYYMRLMFGDQYYPNAAVDMHRIGVIRRGTIYTNAYDTSVDWSTVQDFSTQNVLRAGANGRVTVNSTGALCRDTTVVSVPTASDPWLGLRIEI